MLHGIQVTLGGWMLRGLTALQRRRLGVTVREHTGRRGRRTPWLDLGTAHEGTIVWLHGFADRPDTFLRVASRLHHRHRIIAPAMPAFGDGWVEPDATYDVELFATALHEVLDDIVDDDRVHLVGNSLGGVTALAVAVRRPPWLRSLVPLNSAGVRVHGVSCVLGEFEAGVNLFEVHDRSDYDELMDRLFATRVAVPALIDTYLYDEYARNVDWYVKVTSDLSSTDERFAGEDWTAAVDLGAIEVPTLIVWGDRDTLFPVSHAQVLARAIPNARLELIPGVGHCPHLESPGRLARALRRFVQTL